jgi:epoxyqueuosine reductase
LTQSKHSIPEAYRVELGERVYGCDICQDVCPWNRGVEKRRDGDPLPEHAEPNVSLVDWLEAEDAELGVRYQRLFVPRNDPRYLRRNALIALGNNGGEEHRELLDRYVASEDTLLREHAEWARERLDERAAS